MGNVFSLDLWVLRVFWVTNVIWYIIMTSLALFLGIMVDPAFVDRLIWQWKASDLSRLLELQAGWREER